LRPNGEVVIVGADIDHPNEDTILTEWRRVLTVLVMGCARFPALRELLPQRGLDAVDCRCRAIPLFAGGNVLCPECSGLGWV